MVTLTLAQEKLICQTESNLQYSRTNIMTNGLINKQSNLIRMCQLELWTQPLSGSTFMLYSSMTVTKNWHKSTFLALPNNMLTMSMIQVADMSLQRMKSSSECMVSRTIRHQDAMRGCLKT